MAGKYVYKVRDEDGKTIEGTIESVSMDNAARTLRSKNYLIVSMKEETTNELSELMDRFVKVKTDDVVNFTRQLATMIKAGLPLTQALSILQTQSSQAMGRIITNVRNEVEGGTSLAKALEKAGEDAFSKVYIALVKAGETAGVLDKILLRLADTLEKQRDFRGKVKGAMLYPVIVIIGMIVVTVIMLVFVLPKMTDLYKDFGAELPTATRILIGLSDFMVKFWYVLFILAGLGIYAFRKWQQTEVGGLLIEQALFKTPVLGPLKKKVLMTEFTRTMGLLVGAGISILDALRITMDVVDSKIVGRQIAAAAERVEKGQSLGVVLSSIEQFPPIVPQMVAVGEQTGKVDDILDRLSAYFEAESATAVKTLTTVMEPLIMVVMGVGVGFLVMAVIMPIYNLTSQF